MPEAPIAYTSSLDGIAPLMLRGFFESWPNPPSPETHLRLLVGSRHVVLALDREPWRVVGFINAISDGFFAASIPLLEVLPAYRERGIGSELVRRMLRELCDYYAVDIACDEPLQRFYQRFGLQPGTGMMLRNYGRQATGAG